MGHILQSTIQPLYTHLSLTITSNLKAFYDIRKFVSVRPMAWGKFGKEVVLNRIVLACAEFLHESSPLTSN